MQVSQALLGGGGAIAPLALMLGTALLTEEIDYLYMDSKLYISRQLQSSFWVDTYSSSVFLQLRALMIEHVLMPCLAHPT